MSSLWCLAPVLGILAARRVALIALACAVSVAAPLVAAQDGETAPGYTVTTWSEEDGLQAGDVFAMAQDHEGYLWLGTNSGVVRFDGHQFVPWHTRTDTPLPRGSVPALLGARDGSIWVGYAAGGVTRIQGGAVHSYPAGEDGLADGSVSALLEDRAGRVWMGSAGGLSALENERWTRFDEPDSFEAASISSLYEDRSGALWIGTSAGVYRRAAEGASFELVDGHSAYVQGFVEDSAGAIWITDTQRIVQRIDARGHQQQYAAGVRLPTAGWRLLATRNGDVWIAALGGGLLRLRGDSRSASAVIEPAHDANVAGSPRSLFEDRDHNIWVGIRGAGLARLSPGLFETDTPLDGLTNDGVRAMAAAANGDIWVATGHNLNRFAGSTRHVFEVSQTLALHEDRTQTLWVSTAQGVGRFVDGRVAAVPMSPRIRLDRMASITTDVSGRLWLCNIDHGLLSLQDGVISPYAGDAAISGKPCTFTYSDRAGRVWVALSRSGVAVYENGHFTLYDTTAGMPESPVLAISEDAGGAMWLVTASSLSRLQNGRFTTIGSRNGLPGKIGPSMVEDEAGYVWLGINSGANIIRLHRREMDAVAANGSHFIKYALYDQSDGLQSELHWVSRPGAALAGDGRLWFVTGRGVAVIDPRRARAKRESTAVRIERGVVGERIFAPVPQATLPYSSSLQVDYTAPSLSAGSKMRFRHMLEGLETDWVDAGSQRSARYAALPSGSYRLRVVATGADDWNESEAVWSFVVQAPFYQTGWFYGAGVFCTALLLLGYSRLRLRAVRRQFALVSAERARVSREIHDTLLQSLGAVGLELEVVASELDPSQHTSRDALRRLRRRVVSCIGEARHSIWELRSPVLESRTLADALRDFADDLTSSRAVDVEVAVTGRERDCGPEIAHQLLRIAQEATHNAVRHGEPKQVRIELHYEQRSLSLRVHDDGCGFMPDTEPEAWTGEHWGLVSMRERAARIDGHFSIVSQPGRGTVVQTTVSFR